MTWNNRIFKHVDAAGNIGYEMHECHYDETGKMMSHTINSTYPYGDTVEELIKHLEQLLTDANRFKDNILDYEE